MLFVCVYVCVFPGKKESQKEREAGSVLVNEWYGVYVKGLACFGSFLLAVTALGDAERDKQPVTNVFQHTRTHTHTHTHAPPHTHTHTPHTHTTHTCTHTHHTHMEVAYTDS